MDLLTKCSNKLTDPYCCITPSLHPKPGSTVQHPHLDSMPVDSIGFTVVIRHCNDWPSRAPHAAVATVHGDGRMPDAPNWPGACCSQIHAPRLSFPAMGASLLRRRILPSRRSIARRRPRARSSYAVPRCRSPHAHSHTSAPPSPPPRPHHPPAPPTRSRSPRAAGRA